MGLCPQETILVEDLSVEEHLLLFARIKGTPGRWERECVERCLAATDLGGKRHAFPGELSGGMRRRLAIGCALVGAAALSVLDEPTTGLDPITRRKVWEAIAGARDEGSCVLLTTHMLEEAEELCTDIVIINKGVVATQGSVQELKELWGTGYTLSVDVQSGEEERARAYVASLLEASCQQPVKRSRGGQMVFKVGRDAEAVGRLFLALAGSASANGIRHWGVSQASLEDAYIRIILREE